MTEDFKNTFKVACIYMTTVIGAGFASGQEIMQFFSTYNTGGFYGIILSGILFSLIGYIVLDKVYNERIQNYSELVYPMVGWFLGWIMELIVTLFMMCLFCVMIAGMGNVVTARFDIQYNNAIVIMSIICMIAMLTDIKGIMNLSAVITPVLIVGMLFIGIYIIVQKDTSVFGYSGYLTILTNNWLVSALTYVSYNSIMSIVVMSSLLPYLKSRRVGITGGIAGGMLLCVIAFIINVALFLFYPEIKYKELPMLSIVSKNSEGLSNIYTLLLWLAMFTSAIISGYYFINRLSSKLHMNIKVLTVIASALVIPMASLGFSNLIANIYPVFGYAGIFMVFAVLMQGIKFKKIRLKLKGKK